MDRMAVSTSVKRPSRLWHSTAQTRLHGKAGSCTQHHEEAPPAESAVGEHDPARFHQRDHLAGKGNLGCFPRLQCEAHNRPVARQSNRRREGRSRASVHRNKAIAGSLRQYRASIRLNRRRPSERDSIKSGSSASSRFNDTDPTLASSRPAPFLLHESEGHDRLFRAAPRVI